jgi:DNA replication licensing factor MCM4
VEVIGIYKASGVRINSHNRTLKNVYRTFIDVINYVKTDRRRYDVELKQDGLIEDEKGDVKMAEE